MNNKHPVKIYLTDENIQQIEYMDYLRKKSENNKYNYRRDFDEIVNKVISDNLTDKQRIILENHINGLKNKEIASKLQISESTVCRHLQSAKGKIYAIAQYFYRWYTMRNSKTIHKFKDNNYIIDWYISVSTNEYSKKYLKWAKEYSKEIEQIEKTIDYLKDTDRCRYNSKRHEYYRIMADLLEIQELLIDRAFQIESKFP